MKSAFAIVAVLGSAFLVAGAPTASPGNIVQPGDKILTKGGFNPLKKGHPLPAGISGKPKPAQKREAEAEAAPFITGLNNVNLKINKHTKPAHKREAEADAAPFITGLNNVNLKINKHGKSS